MTKYCTHHSFPHSSIRKCLEQTDKDLGDAWEEIWRLRELLTNNGINPFEEDDK